MIECLSNKYIICVYDDQSKMNVEITEGLLLVKKSTCYENKNPWRDHVRWLCGF